MAKFEVFIPGASLHLPMNVTLRVDAENWLAALKAGLDKLGGSQVASNILCDVKPDNSVEVTDPANGRFFRIQELVEPPPRPAAPPEAPTAPAAGNVTATWYPPPASAAREPAYPEPPPPPAPASPQAAVPETAPEELPRPTPSSLAKEVVEIPGPSAPPPDKIGRPLKELPTEDLLSEIFERAAAVHARTDRNEGLDFLLRLAMEAVGCESGSALVSGAGGQLTFAVALGPKGPELLELGLTIPMGVGIVGFSAQEDVCFAVSDVEKDPRFYRAVSQAIGYPTYSLLCAPISSGGRVLGALELVNKHEGEPFDQGDLAVLSYLAHEAGQFLEAMGA